MAVFAPDATIQIARIPVVYGWLVQEPMVISSLASDWHDEAGTSVDGRYHKASGETHGTPILKRQDTYLQGTANRTGFAFQAVQGQWLDDYIQPKYHTYCLGVSDGAPSISPTSVYEVVAVSAPTDVEHAELWLQWGEPPVATGNADYSHARDKRYTYVHIAYQSPDRQDYRVAFEYGQPIRLDCSYDGGANWELGVAVLRDLGNFERFLQNNGSQINLRITPSLGYQTIGIEVGDGHMLTHTPDKSKINPAKHITPFADSDHPLPRNGKIRVLHRNGTLKFAYYPERFQDLVVTKSPINLGDKLKDATGAFVTGNGLLASDSTQQNTASVTVDGSKVSWKATATKPDAGDGQGSSTPPRFSDVSIVIPAIWDTLVPGQPADYGTGVVSMNAYHVEEIETWDDVTRCAHQSATIVSNNFEGEWNGLFGNLAISVQASNGGAYWQRMQGIVDDNAGGITFSRRDPYRTLTLQCADKSRMMMRALDEERIFDGWCIYSAVRYLCEKGNIHPSFLQTIPTYVPPGAAPTAPYGAAGYDCPFYSLPRGTGLQPFMRWYPDASIWTILQSLVQFMSSIDPGTGLPVAWYMGFDSQGQFHFEPVSLYNLPVAMAYSTVDPSGAGLIEGELLISNSVGDMRTSIDFQGIDANSYELLIEHREQPWQVQICKGYRDPWLERSAVFCSGDYIKYAADVAQFQTSIPRQTIQFKAPFQPHVHAGAKIAVTDPMLGGTQLFSITRMISRYGYNMNGMADCHSIIQARSILSTL